MLVSLSLMPPTAGSLFTARTTEAGEGPPNTPERIDAESNPGRLEKAGVTFALVSGGFDRPDQIAERIRTAIARGLSRDAALRALTLMPATILGVGPQLGTIEKGKIANLTLLEGEVFAEKTRVRQVVIDGEFFAPATPPAGTLFPPAVPPHRLQTPKQRRSLFAVRPSPSRQARMSSFKMRRSSQSPAARSKTDRYGYRTARSKPSERQ